MIFKVCDVLHWVNLFVMKSFSNIFNELLLETEWPEVILLWWFVSIKFIKSFLKFSFLMFLFKRFPF